MLVRLRAVGLIRGVAPFQAQRLTGVAFPALQSARSFATGKTPSPKEQKPTSTAQPKPPQATGEPSSPTDRPKGLMEPVDPLLSLPGTLKNTYGQAGNSATRLYNLAKQQKVDLKTVREGLEKYAALMKKDSNYIANIMVPTSAVKHTGIDQKKKEQIMQDALKSLKLNPLVEKTLFDLTKEKEGKVTQHVDDMIPFLDIIANADKKELPVVIKTAEPLTKEQSKKLHAKLKDWATSTGLTPIIKEVVDPKVVGGLVVTAGDQYLDQSVATRLRKLETVFSVASENKDKQASA